VESTWEGRDLPVLDAVVRLFDEDVDVMPDVAQIAGITGRDPAEVHRALRALEGPFIHVPNMSVGASAENYLVDGVTAQARRAVGQWPSPELWADRIIRALVEAAEREPDEAKRTKLRAAADALGGFGRDLFINVIANVATKPIGF
jgi:hypothetical protein